MLGVNERALAPGSLGQQGHGDTRLGLPDLQRQRAAATAPEGWNCGTGPKQDGASSTWDSPWAALAVSTWL